MRTKLNWLLSASLGLGAAVFVGCDRNNTVANNTNKDNTAAADHKVLNNKNDAASVAGTQIPGDQIGSVDLGKIYGTLSDTAEAALTKDGFDDLCERLSAPDRDRIGKFANEKFADLNARVDQLNNDYNSKYNGKFKLDKDKVFENWAKVQKTNQDADKTYANVMIPAGHGAPALTVPVVKDHEAWKIDVPDDMTGQQLKQNLQDHLTEADNMKSQWPSDQLEGQRALVHHVLEAVMNKPATK
jgi:hypothetical protein